MSTGNLTTARRAVRDYVANNFDNLLSNNGSTRCVFLYDGVVYKVDSWQGANAMEYDNIHNLADALPENVWFPEVSLYRVGKRDVIAMEYIEGTQQAACNCTKRKVCQDDCMPSDLCHLMTLMGMDSTGFNVVAVPGGHYIIDAA